MILYPSNLEGEINVPIIGQRNVLVLPKPLWTENPDARGVDMLEVAAHIHVMRDMSW